MHRTTFAGLSAPDAGESTQVDNGDFIYRNPDLIDQFLRIGAVSHRHDEHTPLPNPTVRVDGGTVASAGTLQSSTPYFVTYTLTDKNGGETLPAPKLEVDTGGQVAPPSVSVTAVADHTGGILPAGAYAYAQTYTDGDGGETTLGPVTWVTVDPGHASAQVKLGLQRAPGTGHGRLWRSYEGADWHLVVETAASAYTDSGFDPPDNPAEPPDANTTGGVSSIFITLPSEGAVPAISEATSIRVYLSTDDAFASPSLYTVLPIACAGTTLVITDDSTSDGQPPKVSSSVPGAGRIDPDTDMLWALKSPVQTAGDLPSGAVGDVRIVLTTEHLYGVLGPSAVAGAGGWTDLTAKWLSDVKAMNDGVNISGSGDAAGWEIQDLFAPSGTATFFTGAAVGYGGSPLTIPTSTRPGDFMLLAVAVNVGEQVGEIPGWNFVGSGASDVGGEGCRLTVYSRFASVWDPGSRLPEDLFTNEQNNGLSFIAAHLRSYRSAGIAATRFTAPSTTPTALSPPGVGQVSFFATYGLPNNDGDRTPQYKLQFTVEEPNPGPEANQVGLGATNLPTHSGVVGNDFTPGAAQMLSEDFFGAVSGGAVHITKDPDYIDPDPKVGEFDVTLLPPTSLARGSIADFATPGLSGDQSLVVPSGGLLTTGHVPSASLSTGGDPFGSNKKYSAQWTEPGMLAAGYKVRARVEWGDIGHGNPGVASIVVNMGAGSGLAFWWGIWGAGWTTDMSALDDATIGEIDSLTAADESLDGPFLFLGREEFWVEVSRVGNLVQAAIFDNDPSDPKNAAFPLFTSSRDVTGDPHFGPTVAGYWGFTFDFLGSQSQGISEIELFKLQPNEILLGGQRTIRFVGSGGTQVSVRDMSNTLEGLALGDRAVEVLISGGGTGTGSGATGPPGSPGPAGPSVAIAESGGVHKVNPAAYVEFAASGGATIGVLDLGGGSARVTLGAGSTTGGTPYASGARAHLNAAQNIGSNSWTQVKLDTVDYGQNFAVTGFNHQYIAPSAGQYQVNGQVMVQKPTSTTKLAVAVYVNGSEVSRGEERDDIPTTGTEYGLTVSDSIALAAGDSVDLRVWSSSVAVDMQAGFSQFNYLSVAPVGWQGAGGGGGTGPQGPSGAVGPAGASGAVGPQGPAGSAANFVASAGTASAIVGPFLGFAGSGGVSVQLIPQTGSAVILISASGLQGPKGDPGAPGTGGGGAIEISASAGASAITPVVDIEFGASAGVDVSVQSLGGGSARVLIGQSNTLVSTTQASGYAFAASDVGAVVESPSAGVGSGAIGFLFRTHANVPLPLGAVIEIFEYGTGQVQLAAEAGVTLRSDGNRTRIAGQFGTVQARQRAIDEWVLSGDLI